MIVFDFHSKFSLIECWSLALRQWQNWMDLNQNLWEEMKKRTWILELAFMHTNFSFRIYYWYWADQMRTGKKIPRLVKMKKMPIVLWFCAKKQNVGHLNIEWQRTDEKKKENEKGYLHLNQLWFRMSQEKRKSAQKCLKCFVFVFFVGNGSTKSVFVFTI